MRRSAVLTALALAASTLALAPPALAMTPFDQFSERGKAKLDCTTAVVSADAQGRVRYDLVQNDKVKDSTSSKGRLGFDVDAWGLYESVNGAKVDTLSLNAITGKSVRRVTLTFRGQRKIGLSSKKYAPQGDFRPRLFADASGFYAYIVTKKGGLERWSLTRYANGAIRYANRIVIDARGYDDLTSLQATTFFRLNGADKEVLYGTTADGALIQITVPVGKPRKEKVRTILDSGYAGVTELSWSICNDDLDHASLIAIDPETGAATWTTIKNSNKDPKASLHGEVRGGEGWKNVTALL